jgi:hypothetical protein
MARKKQLVPHFVRGNAFDCENPFEFGKSGNWLEYTSKGRFVETANNQFLPPPLSGWQEKVFTADTRCNKLNLHRVEAIIKDYVASRVR